VDVAPLLGDWRTRKTHLTFTPLAEKKKSTQAAASTTSTDNGAPAAANGPPTPPAASPPAEVELFAVLVVTMFCIDARRHDLVSFCF
jgi:hypothetical protein